MKNSSLLLFGAAGVAIWALTRSSPASATPASAPGTTPPIPPGPLPISAASPGAPLVDPTVGTWSIISWDVLKVQDPALVSSMSVPDHSYITTNSLSSILPTLPGAPISLGSVASWIRAQNLSGHKVFQAPPVTDANGATIAEVYALDTAPPGWNFVEVTA